MLSARTECPELKKLIAQLDEAVDVDCVHGRCDKVKQILEDAFHSSNDFLPPDCIHPAKDHYARHLLHLDPQGRYSVIAMVWDVDQGTPIHDHAGQWCVECVYRGRIKVVSYDHRGETEDGLVRFDRVKEVFAGVGEAGALIPPFEYHTIENAQQTPTITIHVYGEELEWCHVFVPEGDGLYRKVRKELSYTSR